MINTWFTLPAETALALRRKHPIISVTAPESVGTTLAAVLDVPHKDAPPQEWKFQFHTGWLGYPHKSDLDSPEKAVYQFKTTFAACAEPFHSVAAAMPDDAIPPVDDGWQFNPIGDFTWNNHGGKVTLAGDAAHSMLPHRGQGLNNAIMDAAGLVEVVEKVTAGAQELSEAVKAYEEEMRPRGAKEVELSFQAMQANSTKNITKSPLYKFVLHRYTEETGA